MGKWFWPFVGVSIALVIAIVVAVVIGLNLSSTTPEGPETGTYYCDTDTGVEYVLELHSGDRFVLNDGVARVGTYTTADDGTVSFVFDKESNGSATATFEDGVVLMNYNNAQIRFLRKFNYTVSFDTAGGTTVENVLVVNGRPVAKPADPEKENAKFIGWYADAAFTKPYAFGSTPITADTTIYARFVPTVLGQIEYEIKFEGADVAAMTTAGGKVYALPVPEKKDGYTFGGWWISDYNDGDKLTYKCEEGTTLDANTTLFAVWVPENSDMPLPQVDASGVKWDNVATTYKVVIKNPLGDVVYDQNVGANVLSYNFDMAGCYVIEVTANGVTDTRYYNAKALSRVSVFEVIDSSVLLFNAVEGAEKYYVTVNCGNPAHKHVMVDNGKSVVFNFANCEMKEGGIEFTVTATARGYSSSTSSTFVYERKLDKVTEIVVDPATETVTWTAVDGAAYYLVEVNGKTVVAYLPTCSIKNFAGELTIKVTPVTDGFLSPEAATTTFNKTTLATPADVAVNGMVINWTAVEGATGYTVKIGAKVFTTTTNSLDLVGQDIAFVAGIPMEISVMATGEKNSLYSDALVVYFQTFTDALVYENGYVYWTPVVGPGSYEVKVNGADSVVVSGTDRYALTFNKAGVNTVAVRYVSDGYNSEWISVDIFVYCISFDARLGTAVPAVYVAAGDALALPVPTRVGYTFNGWYTTPSAAAGNGKLFDDATYGEKDDIILYANWNANKYGITVEVEEDVTGVENGTVFDVYYDNEFVLPVPKSDKGTFLGWFTGPGGSGYQLADAAGKGVKKYNVAGNTTVYPFFETGTLDFVLQLDGTYAVTQGPNVDQAVHIIIPETYDGVPVTVVLENAFKYCSKLQTLSIPNTVTLVGQGAFTGCKALEEVNVREIEGVVEPVYWSADGVLFREDFGANTYLEYFPRNKAGDFEIPAGVESILTKAFQYAYRLENLTIGVDVTSIAQDAFFYCYELRTITFAEGGSKDLVIEEGAFTSVSKLERIKLPARLTSVSASTLNKCSKLAVIDVEVGGLNYGSVDGMLTNADMDTILYCPAMRRGQLTIPVGITAIGNGAFATRTELTGVEISNKVVSIGENAFSGCESLMSVTFVGGRNEDLVIGASAFANCRSLTNVSFLGGETMDIGTVTIGDYAFANSPKIRTLVLEDNANLLSIGEAAFKGCSLSELRIPATLIRVGESAFEDCESMVAVSFAENCQDIDFGASVFKNCSITAVTLPSTLSNFNGSVFAGCDVISEIIVDADNPYLTSVDGVLYNKAMTELVFYPKSKSIEFNKLPNTLTSIGPAALQGHPGLTSITVPAEIVNIGANAFDGCPNLTYVAFAGYNKDIKIGDYAFANCSKLDNVVLADTITAIGNYSFYHTALSKIRLPSRLETVGNFAFAKTELKEVILPATLTKLGAGAYSDCTALTSVSIVSDIGLPLTIGGNTVAATGAFQGCTALTEVTLPKRTVVIGANTFRDCEALTTVALAADSNVVSIEAGAFANTPAFTGIVLPEDLTYIGENAFNGANNAAFTTVVVPYTVKEIGYRAFYDTVISSFTFAPTPENTDSVPLVLGDEVLGHNLALTEITIPKRASRFFSWEVTQNGADYTNLFLMFGTKVERLVDQYDVPWISGFQASIAAVNIEEGHELYMSIDGVVYEKDAYGNAGSVIYCPPAKTGDIVIPSTVVELEYMSFPYSNLNSITFEEIENWDGVPTLSIGTSRAWTNEYNSADQVYPVFVGGTIKKIQFPAHLKEFNSGAMYYVGLSFNSTSTTGVSCTQTATLQMLFNENTQPIYLRPYAINDSYNIVRLDLPAIASFETYCLQSNQRMQYLTFAPGTTATEMADYAIFSASGLKEIEIPASIEKLGEASCGNSSLTSFTFEEGSQIRYLASRSVAGKFTSFTLPDTVETLEKGWMTTNSVTDLTIGKNLKTTILADGTSLIQGLTKLQRVHLSEENPYMVLVDGALYDKNMTTLLYVGRDAYETTNEKGKLVGKQFVIPETVTTIESCAFYYFNYQSGTRYAGISNIVIPEGVVKIGNYAFDYAFYYPASQPMEFVIPASVEEIGAYAFRYCRNVTDFKFGVGSRLTSMGDYAFQRCSGITKFDMPDTVTYMGEYYTFQYCTALESVNLSAVTKIPTEAFSSDTKLAEVIIPEGVEIMERRAFKGCTALTEIHLPASLRETTTANTDGAFTDCTALKVITFAEGSKLTKLGSYTFENCKALEEMILPSGVEALNVGVFDGCSSLKYVELNGIWTDIPANYFAGNTALETVVLSDTALVIGDGAFDGCTNLTSINLPETLNEIGKAAFRGTPITEVYLGAGISKIGDFAFDGCTELATVTFDPLCALTALGNFVDEESAIFRGTTSLTSIELPSTLKTIGANIFEGSAITSVTLPETVGAISNYAFKDCVNLTKVFVPESVNEIGDYAFDGCINLTEATIADGVESIGAGVFRNCTALTASNIPATVKKLGGNPFINCPNLTLVFDNANSMYSYESGVIYDAGKRTLLYYSPTKTEATYTLPETVTILADGAFSNSQLEEFTLPVGMVKIPDMLFFGCSKLNNVTIPAGVKEIGASAFEGCASFTEIFVPYNTVKLGDGAFAGCSNVTVVTFENQKETIEIGDRLFDGCASLTSFVMPIGITTLGDYMFAGTGITEFTVPATVTSLRSEGVFANSALTTITFENGSTLEADELNYCYLGDYFFYNCKNLNGVVLPEKINAIGTWYWVGRSYDASHTCSGPTCTMSQPQHIYANDSYAFAGCTSLTSIDLKYVTVIGNHAFDGCTALTEALFPSGSSYFAIMGDYAFANCTSLLNIDMSKRSSLAQLRFVAWNGNVHTIGYSYVGMSFGNNIFENCTSLEKVQLTNMTNGAVYGTELFKGCTNLKEISNMNVRYFRVGADPFKGMPENVKIYFKNSGETVDPTNEGGIFYAKDDMGKVYPNAAWLKAVKPGTMFNYSTLLNYAFDAEGNLTEFALDDFHEHLIGCEACAPLKYPTQTGYMNSWKALANGESMIFDATASLTQVMVREILVPYDPETGTVTYLAYYHVFYETPIIVTEAVNAAGKDVAKNIVTGALTTLQSGFEVKNVDGQLYFLNAQMTVCNAKANMSSGQYVIGNEYEVLEKLFPTTATEDMKIALPSTFFMEALEAVHNEDNFLGYYWSSDNDAITFVEEEDENGDMITYMVIKQQATTQTVNVTVNINYWGTRDYLGRITIVVEAK